MVAKPLPGQIAMTEKPPAGAKEAWRMTQKEFESQVALGTLYHVTKPENLAKITRTGLKAQISKKVSFDERIKDPVVYGFETLQQARDFAYDNNMMDNHVVLKINTKDYVIVPDPEYTGNDLGIKSFGVKGNIKPSDVLDVTQYHKDAITKALSEGKPVPPEVLKDYPDLKESLAKRKPDTASGSQAIKQESKLQSKEASDPRSKIAIATDRALQAKTVTTNTEDWVKQRSNIDLQGVDTIISERRPRISGKKYRITPNRPRIGR